MKCGDKNKVFQSKLREDGQNHMGVCKKLRDLLDAISLFRNTLTLHRKRTRSSSIALGIVNPSLTCQQTCRLGNNNAHALQNYKTRTCYRTTKRMRVMQFYNACAFCKFKKIKIKTHSPPPESHFHETEARFGAWKSAQGA